MILIFYLLNLVFYFSFGWLSVEIRYLAFVPDARLLLGGLIQMFPLSPVLQLVIQCSAWLRGINETEE